MLATNVSQFKTGVGDKMLAPGQSIDVDDELAERIDKLGAGLVRIDEAKPARGKKAKVGGGEAVDMSSWTPARVRNWAAKQEDSEVIRTALAGDLRDQAREELELRLMALEEGEPAEV